MLLETLIYAILLKCCTNKLLQIHIRNRLHGMYTVCIREEYHLLSGSICPLLKKNGAIDYSQHDLHG